MKKLLEKNFRESDEFPRKPLGGNPSDFLGLPFVFKDKVLEKSSYLSIDPSIKRIKIDIGLSDNAMHSGVWLGDEHNYTNDLLVFGFEADPDNVSLIKNRPDSYSRKKIPSKFIDKNFYIINCALGNPGPGDSDVTYLYKDPNNDPDKSSLFIKRDSEGSSNDSDDSDDEYLSRKRVTVPYMALSEFLDLIPWDQIYCIDYIKINTNGSDFRIIQGLEKYLHKIAFITFNPDNSYKDCHNNYYDILRFLKEHNFENVNEFNIRPLKSFSIDPTFFNKNLKNDISMRCISYYQIGSIGSLGS